MSGVLLNVNNRNVIFLRYATCIELSVQYPGVNDVTNNEPATKQRYTLETA